MGHDLLIVFLVILIRFRIIGVARSQSVKSIDVKIVGEIVEVLLPYLGVVPCACLAPVDKKQGFSLALVKVSSPNAINIYVLGIFIPHRGGPLRRRKCDIGYPFFLLTSTSLYL
jgi:hypothetical protein